MRAGQRKSCRAVIERRSRKAHGRVTCGAIAHRECRSRSGVRGSVGSLPASAIIRTEVAAGISAIGRRNAQRVVAVNVAERASHGCVRVRQRKSSGVVVKNSRRPCRDGMAGGAGRRSCRETGGEVVRNVAANRCGALECRRVASIAIR
jgi:hypothetical protein